MESFEQRGGREAQRISEILPGALSRLGPSGLWTEARVRRVWEAAVGPQVAANARIHRLRGRTLEVIVDEDTWATQLRYLSSVLRQKINTMLGQEAVAEVTVRRVRKPRG